MDAFPKYEYIRFHMCKYEEENDDDYEEEEEEEEQQQQQQQVADRCFGENLSSVTIQQP